MPDPLWSARLKLDRAAQHLKALEVEVRDFAYKELNRFLAERDPQSREPFVPTWLQQPLMGLPEGETVPGHWGVSLPDRWSPIVGDFLTNLRASLDHAVNGLAGDAAGENTKFPISRATTRQKFERNTEGERVGVPGPRWAQIERMQPYHGHRRGRRLRLLAALVNFDKHKVLHTLPYLQYSIAEPGHVGMRGFQLQGVLGDKTFVTATWDGTNADPKVEGGPAYLIFLSNAPYGTWVASNYDLEILMDEVGQIIVEFGNPPPKTPQAAHLTEPPFG